MQDEKDSVDWGKIELLNQKLPASVCPRISIIIPTCNDAKKIGFTLDNLLLQDYPDFEILVIDAASRDRTIEIVQSYHDKRIHLSSVSDYNRYEMMNKGIFLAQGTYINFLMPGDYYISIETQQIMMQLATAKQKPHLVYCGCLLREAQNEVKTLFRKLDLVHLKKGLQPTSLQSCWFHRSVFQQIGKFNTHYTLRGGFDLFCRFILNDGLSHFGIKRMLTDYELREVSAKMVLKHSIETMRILLKNFGFLTAVCWLFSQKDFRRYCRFWHAGFKKAFFKN